MTSQLPSKERLQEIIDVDARCNPEVRALARFALAAHEQEPIYQVWDDGNWADYDKAAFEAAQGMSARSRIVYAHPAPVPAVPWELTAEQQRIINMLLNVCGAAFELADDCCQQEVDGESCHVIADASFVKLSDALDEIENSLPTEDADRPDVFLAWSAMPRAALKSLLTPAPSVPAVVPDGYVLMPMKLTAENGAKYALSGEFHVLHRVTCHECGGEGCSDCDDDGWLEEKIMIGWDDIKDIYRAAVEACSIKSTGEGV